jgi:hypothetical protein
MCLGGRLACVLEGDLKISTITADNESFWRVALDTRLSRHGNGVLQLMVEEARQKYNKTAIDHSLPDSSRAYIIIQPAEGAYCHLCRSLVSHQLKTSSNGNDERRSFAA